MSIGREVSRLLVAAAAALPVVAQAGFYLGAAVGQATYEDFDDALLYMWFDDESVAQVQVSRNHVSGYRVESILFGENGQIHIGRFDQRLFDITVEAYGRRGREEALASKTFTMRRYESVLPEFADRFGAAYKAETQIAPGDTLRIAVMQGAVTYSKNSAVFYASTTRTSYPLLVNATLFDLGATLMHAVIATPSSSSARNSPESPAPRRPRPAPRGGRARERRRRPPSRIPGRRTPSRRAATRAGAGPPPRP